MQKLKTFFVTLFRSCSDPQYYRDILAAKASFSWKYFALFNLLISIAMGVLFAVPVTIFDPTTLANEAITAYPSDLELVMEDSQLSINQELPYVIELPRSLDEEGEEYPAALVTFTSNEEFAGVPYFDQYDSLAVVTETTAYFRDDAEIRSYNFDQLESDDRFVLNYEVLESFKNEMLELPFVKYRLYVPLILAAVVMVVFPAMMLFRVLTLVFYSVGVLLLAKFFLKQREFSYGKLLQVSLHSITPVILVSWALSVTGLFQLEGWLYFFSYLGWTMFVLSRATDPHEVVAVSAPEVKKPRVKKSTKVKSKKA